MITVQLKKKLRQLKKAETQIRFKNLDVNRHKKYVWDKYFSTKNEEDTSVKYSMNSLCNMTHEELKTIFDEYFYQVYYEYYKENGISDEEVQDGTLLTYLGLPIGSSKEEIKSRFRELAKKYHPDLGGDSDKFIELMEQYKKLTDDQ